MYSIKVKAVFSAAHNLKNYKGKCERLHGHNWNVEATFAYGKLGRDGLAIDFKEAKSLLNSVLEKLDHSHLNSLKILGGMNPTSENLARFIYEAVRKRCPSVNSVSVWENDSSCASYYES
jgi:6-pyruvoyltetrahydropterin/6-carboxytetrahydropterin synthase